MLPACLMRGSCAQGDVSCRQGRRKKRWERKHKQRVQRRREDKGHGETVDAVVREVPGGGVVASVSKREGLAVTDGVQQTAPADGRGPRECRGECRRCPSSNVCFTGERNVKKKQQENASGMQQTPRGCARCHRCTSRQDNRRGTQDRCWCTRCRAPCCAGRKARRQTGLLFFKTSP